MNISFDEHNYRVHNDKSKELISKSLEECGVGRSILIDGDNKIIAGNGVYGEIKKLGLKEDIIETDGKELIVIVRKDLHTKDKKRKKLAVYDNSCADKSEFDLDMMQADFDESQLIDMGVEIKTVSEKDYDNSEIDINNLTNDLDCICPECGLEFKRK